MQDARISIGLPAHPKTKKLIRRIGAAGGWHLVCLLLWTASNRSDGCLAGLTGEDIELAADWRDDDGVFVAALCEVGFLDGSEGGYSVHDWAEHNPWAAGAEARSEKAKFAALCKQHGRREAARMMPEYAKRISEALPKQDDSMPSSASSTTVAVPDSASSTPVARSSSAPSPSPSPSPKAKAKNTERQVARFDDFWNSYPNKKGKVEARKAWSRKSLDGIADRIIADVKARMVNDRDWVRGYVPHGSTYVNAEGWEDAVRNGDMPEPSGRASPELDEDFWRTVQ